MSDRSTPRPPRRRFVAGLAAGFLLSLLLGEIVIRLRLPDDLQPYLGEDSSRTGIYRPDPDLGVDYRSLEDFRSLYADRLKELEDPARPRRIWAWFGNSFAQAPGMLADMAQTQFPEIAMFHLRRNAEMFVHVAQMRLLLESGLKPERIIFVLLPIDTVSLGRQPLETILVNRGGAITYRLRAPPATFDTLVRASRLAQLAWVRSGQHIGNPSFQPKQSTEFMTPSLQEDFAAILSVLGATARKHQVPVTILLLPNREQIFGKAGYAPQDFLRARCRAEGLDCFDARDLFAREQNKLSLFLPDWHFTPKGNRMILEALVEHWKAAP